VKLLISKDLAKLSASACEEFIRIANESIAQRGAFRVALSGGSTPIALYQRLATAQLDWSRVFFFFGDERNVPPDDAQSNFRMAEEQLFQPLSIEPERIYRWRTEVGAPDAVAEDYRTQLHIGWLKGLPPDETIEEGVSRFIGNDLRFDLIVLGMGADGHTASLFPGTMALQFTSEIAVANWVPQLDQWRFTLTFTAINNARNVMFLVSGAEKACALRGVLEGRPDPDLLPAQSVQPTDGGLFWFVDKEAASELTT
jgi:6-phosphogluconolactonase